MGRGKSGFAGCAGLLVAATVAVFAAGNASLAQQADFERILPINHGHFLRSAEAFRHWDGEGKVPPPCSRCHTSGGLPLFLNQGAVVESVPSDSLGCATCHDDLIAFTRRPTTGVPFPSGAEISLIGVDPVKGPDSNLCLNCHQGRESTLSMDRLIGDADDDRVADTLRFLNVHYFAAGASLFGTEARGAYEYADHAYRGRNRHVAPMDVCTECHQPHQTGVRVSACQGCHQSVAANGDVRTIRMRRVDYDGDGDTREGIAGEIDSMEQALLAAMNAYADRTSGVDPVSYDPARYPYFFSQTTGEGYKTWTPRLLRAAYNYQYVQKDPGGFAHNGKYLLQVLYDSLADLGAETAGMTRPD